MFGWRQHRARHKGEFPGDAGQAPSGSGPAEVQEFQPEVPVSLDKKIFLQSLQSARRGSFPGPGDVFDLVFEAASSVAQGRVPADIQGPLMSARLTALSKDDGGVRGIATGCTFRRLVARSLARQFAEDFEKECAPIPVRTVHASRDRLRGAHVAGGNRQR